jgi:hypothetical protein
MNTTTPQQKYHLRAIIEGMELWLGTRRDGEAYWKPSREGALAVDGGLELDRILRLHPQAVAIPLDTPAAEDAKTTLKAEAVLTVQLPGSNGNEIEVVIDETNAKRLTVLFAYTWGWKG